MGHRASARCHGGVDAAAGRKCPRFPERQRAKSWAPRSVGALLCLAAILLWASSPSEGALYYGRGKCKHNNKIYKPGQKFQRGCDKCYCEEEGFLCITPMRPTSWPKKCKPIYMDCGYRLVYRSHPEKECYAYSWVG